VIEASNCSTAKISSFGKFFCLRDLYRSILRSSSDTCPARVVRMKPNPIKMDQKEEARKLKYAVFYFICISSTIETSIPYTLKVSAPPASSSFFPTRNSSLGVQSHRRCLSTPNRRQPLPPLQAWTVHGHIIISSLVLRQRTPRRWVYVVLRLFSRRSMRRSQDVKIAPDSLDVFDRQQAIMPKEWTCLRKLWYPIPFPSRLQ
jgi:hypothetical protein